MKEHWRPFLMGCLVTALVFAILPENPEAERLDIEDLEEMIYLAIAEQVSEDIEQVQIFMIEGIEDVEGLNVGVKVAWEGDKDNETHFNWVEFPLIEVHDSYLAAFQLDPDQIPDDLEINEDNMDLIVRLSVEMDD